MREADRRVYEQALYDAPAVAVSALSVFEARIVLGARNSARLHDFEPLLALF
ncbi:hypothetical protein [Caenispirillum salinarum]|uniref:hypothetical protein n=1 Tax=Caenispirillum salinarum TaxID=859058 RepID=UPI00384FE020